MEKMLSSRHLHLYLSQLTLMQGKPILRLKESDLGKTSKKNSKKSDIVTKGR